MSTRSPILRWLAPAALLLAAGLLWYGGERLRHSTTPEEPPAPPEPYTLSQPITDAYADFSLRLLRTQYRPGENLLLSPMALHRSLSILACGGEGETGAALLRLLGGGCTQEELLKNNRILFSMAAWDWTEDAYALTSSLWLEGGRQFTPVFLERAQAYSLLFPYGSPQEARAGAVAAVGELAAQEGAPDPALLLVSQATFRGEWLHPYEDDFLQNSSFTTRDGVELPAVLLPTEKALYLAGEGYGGFIKSLDIYPAYSFVVLVPDRDSDIETLLATLTGQQLRSLVLEGGQEGHLLAFLPAFEMGGSLSLKDTLTSLGLQNLFDPEQADLSGLVGGGAPLFLEDVLHRASLRVDGGGITGEDGTLLPLSTSADPTEEPGAEDYHLVFADRPFLFAIVEEESGVPLLLGICERPVTPAGVVGA